MVALLAVNMPSFVRSESEISKMIKGFAHLIEATHLYEGEPMKLVVGYQIYDDVPKEIPVVFGGKEYTMALAVREIVHNRRTRKENIDLIPVNKKRSNFISLAPAKVAGGEKKAKEQEDGSRMAVEGSGKDAVTGNGQGGDAQSSNRPAVEVAGLGQTEEMPEKGRDSFNF